MCKRLILALFILLEQISIYNFPTNQKQEMQKLKLLKSLQRVKYTTQLKGVSLFKNFISESEHEMIMKETRNFQKKVSNYLDEKRTSGIISKLHNLTSQESFQNVLIEDKDSTIKCEVFEKYGEEGHTLVYLQNNENVPHFVKDFISEKLLTNIESRNIILENLKKSDDFRFKDGTWKLTVNYYDQVKNNTNYSGFPFHTDIKSNGVVTVILSLESFARMDFIKPKYNMDGFHSTEYGKRDYVPTIDDSLTQFLLEPRSLIIVYGEARYEWMHRVVGGESFDYNGKIYKREPRSSLVLGVK